MLLSTGRAEGVRPKETLLTPNEVKTPGSSFLIWRIDSIVATAELANSGSPVVSLFRPRFCDGTPCHVPDADEDDQAH